MTDLELAIVFNAFVACVLFVNARRHQSTLLYVIGYLNVAVCAFNIGRFVSWLLSTESGAS